MDNHAYFRSITKEINALQNKVRNFIPRHWLTDGQWKESVLRSVLRRHLPKNVGIGSGFIVSATKTSSQIDILLYDTTKPVLFQDNEFVIVTPDCVRGIIEVKTMAEKGKLREIFDKIAENIQIIPTGHTDKKFFGVFFYEAGGQLQDLQNDPQKAVSLLQEVQRASRGIGRRTISCISIADSFFVRYWVEAPDSNRLIERWHAYNLKGKAPAYFIHNVVELLCPDSVLINNSVWFPEGGKEGQKIAELPIAQAPNAPAIPPN